MVQIIWQIWKNKNYFTQQKIFLSILGLLCRIEEINIFIILPSIKNSGSGSSLQIWRNILFYYTKQKNLHKYPGPSLQNWRNKYFYFSTIQKTSLNILGLLCRIEEINIFIILPSIKKILFECPGCSLQIWRNKYFYYSTKQKTSLKYTGSSLQNWK